MKCKTTFALMKCKIAIIFTFALLVACENNGQKTDEKHIAGTPVQITHPQKMDFSEHVELNANTVFMKKEIIRCTFQGFIKRMFKNIGDNVTKDEAILSVITKEAAAFDSLTSNITEKTLTGSVIITAHSNGVLTSLNFHEGDFVSEGEEIAVISNPSSLYFTLNVPYSDTGKLKHQNTCNVFLPDGRSVKTKIQKIIPSVDPASQTQTVLLKPEHLLDLPENLNVTARLDLQTQKDAIIVPRSSVLSNETQDKFWVMKLINDTTAVKVSIQKGLENDSLIQIVQPVLNANDAIISLGGYGLPDSSRVNIME